MSINQFRSVNERWGILYKYFIFCKLNKNILFNDGKFRTKHNSIITVVCASVYKWLLHKAKSNFQILSYFFHFPSLNQFILYSYKRTWFAYADQKVASFWDNSRYAQTKQAQVFNNRWFFDLILIHLVSPCKTNLWE